MRRLRSSAAAVAALLTSAVAMPASASDFTIAPTSITLTNQPAADIAVTNTGTTMVRITVHAYQWTQDAADPEKLTPSDRVVYFPEIFVVPPGGTQRVRVGVQGEPTGKEQAYRLILQELPPAQARGSTQTGITFIGRIDMPVFVPPGHSIAPTRVPSLDAVSVERSAAVARLSNAGTVHVRQSTIVFTGTDARGNAIWHESKQPFYILAGSTQVVRVPIPAATCARLASVSARWTLRDNGGIITKSTTAIVCK